MPQSTVTTLPSAPPGYLAWLAALKPRIRATRLRTALAVNTELIQLYWSIGCDILDRQAKQGWGSKIVDRLAADLRVEFPDARGFSRANLHSMRAFAEAWPNPAIVQRVAGQLPWGQNVELLAVKEPAARIWYAEAALAHGWRRQVLTLQIDTDLHARQGKATTNVARALPPETSDLAHQILKDPYQFDPGAGRVVPRARHRARPHCPGKDLLLELGKGFAFTPVGVARYQLLAADTLPDDLACALPTHDEILPGMLPTDETDNEDALQER